MINGKKKSIEQKSKFRVQQIKYKKNNNRNLMNMSRFYNRKKLYRKILQKFQLLKIRYKNCLRNRDMKMLYY